MAERADAVDGEQLELGGGARRRPVEPCSDEDGEELPDRLEVVEANHRRDPNRGAGRHPAAENGSITAFSIAIILHFV